MTQQWGYTFIQSDKDHLWFDEGLKRGWELPAPARPGLRVWGVRHLRSFWHVWHAYHAFEEREWKLLWYKEWVAYAITKGWV